MAAETPINKGSRKTQRNQIPVRKRLYDLKSAAIYLGRTVWGVRELVWAGKLPVIKDGRKLYVDLQDMDRYIEQNKIVMI